MRPVPRAFLAAFLATFLLIGAMRAFFSTVYFANLATLSINASIAWVALALAPALLLLPLPARPTALASVAVLALGRLAMQVAWGSAWYLGLAGVSFGAALVALACIVFQAREAEGRDAGAMLVAAGMALAFGLDAVLTTMGTSVDLTLRLWPGVLIVAPLALALLYVQTRPALAARAWTAEPHRAWALGGAALGAWLFLEHAVLASPYAMASWDALSVAPLALGTALGLALAVAYASRGPAIPWGWLAAAHVFLALAILDHAFVHSWLLGLWLTGAQAVLALDLAAGLRMISGGGLRRIGGAVLVASLVTVVLHFVFAFGFTFAYVPLSGVWKGSAPWLLLLAVVLARLPGLLVRTPPAADVLPRGVGVGAVLAMMLLASVGAATVAGDVPPGPAPPLPFSVMTFNLHQGFDNDGVVDPDVFVRVLSNASPDVVALQESDTSRITSANLDIVDVLASRLGYHAVHGPPTSAESFGVSILSRYPVEGSHVIQLPSDKDNRYYIEAKLDLGGRAVWFYALHLGLPAVDREAQIDQVLARAATHGNETRILAGDLNSCPHIVCPDDQGDRLDDVYERVAAQYVDTFVATGHNESDPLGYTYAATGLTHRIDYVWVTHDITVNAAESVRTPDAVAASDHVPVLVRLQLLS